MLDLFRPPSARDQITGEFYRDLAKARVNREGRVGQHMIKFLNESDKVLRSLIINKKYIVCHQGKQIVELEKLSEDILRFGNTSMLIGTKKDREEFHKKMYCHYVKYEMRDIILMDYPSNKIKRNNPFNKRKTIELIYVLRGKLC